MIDPVEVYFADGPLQGKFMYVNTWPVKAAVPHEFDARTFGDYDTEAVVEFSTVIYNSHYTVSDVDGTRFRVAYVSRSSRPPTIKSLLIRD